MTHYSATMAKNLADELKKSIETPGLQALLKSHVLQLAGSDVAKYDKKDNDFKRVLIEKLALQIMVTVADAFPEAFAKEIKKLQ